MARNQTLQEIPASAPGYCYFCHVGPEAENREYFLDMGVDVDYEGAVYICNKCLISLIETTNPPDVVSKQTVEKKLEKADEQIDTANKTLEAVELVKAHLHQLGLNFDKLLEAAQDRVDEKGKLAKMDVQEVLDEPVETESSVLIVEEVEWVPDPEPFVFPSEEEIQTQFTFLDSEEDADDEDEREKKDKKEKDDADSSHGKSSGDESKTSGSKPVSDESHGKDSKPTSKHSDK